MKKIKAKTDNNGISPILMKYTIIVISIILTVFLVYKGRFHQEPLLTIGQISDKEIRAQVSFDYIDKEKTKILKEKAAEKVAPVYYIDQKIKQSAAGKIEKLFSTINSVNKTELSADKRLKKIAQIILWLDGDTIKGIMESPDQIHMKETILKLTGNILDKGVVSSRMMVRLVSRGVDSIRLINNDTGKINIINIRKFTLDRDLGTVLENKLRSVYRFNRKSRQESKDILLKVISPNLVLNTKEIKKEQLEASALVMPVYGHIKQGQTVIRKGDPITETHIVQLNAQREKLGRILPEYSKWWNITGIAILTVMLFLFLGLYITYHRAEILLYNKNIFLLALIGIIVLALTRFLLYMPMNADMPFWKFFILIPISAIAVSVLIDKGTALISSVVLSALGAVLTNGGLSYALIALFGSFAAVQATSGIVHRWEFIKAGVFIGIAYMAGILMVSLLKFYSSAHFSWQIFGFQEMGGLASGLFCPVVAGILLPVLERTFDIATDMRLFELSDLNHPLLKKLVTKAPGTYHHSMVVSNIAEDAASAIGANSLLTKAGSYFHDIGKIIKPEYYIENAWFEKESRHEKLLPTMSNLVITAHVKEGVQLAKRYRLPKAVIDVIKEHHGTSIVYYFYKQAEQVSKKNGTKVEESDFRYSGPKPQTRESAIILLADAVEAASRTLLKPTPGKIEILIKEIIDQKILDGQMNECGLTLKDINIIKVHFSHVLTGILHSRVDYSKKNGNKSN